MRKSALGLFAAALTLSILGILMFAAYSQNQRDMNSKKIAKSNDPHIGSQSKPIVEKENAVIPKQPESQAAPSKKAAIKSGIINDEKLPWENDPKFLEMQDKNQTNIRMSAFMTVLPDPLPGEELNVSIAADKIAGTLIMPDEVFSQNRTAGPYTVSRGYKKGPTYSGGRLITTIGGGVCKIATTLYNVAVLGNLSIVERHQHSMIVPYVPPGQDATVYYGSRDIRFMNNKPWPILLWAKSEGNILYMAVYGREKPPKVTWHHEILNESDTYYIYRNNPELQKGVKKVVMEGYKGYKVKSWLTIKLPDGTEKTKNLGMDWYSPMPGLIEVGTGKAR